ncbi:QRFP-like peptide receptor [Gigantopelta aegis]|uniref:QRFP-like peptide receptor n=1 Tax=Gigantopelta aegis TaxID=1735272 RepID=UPI001B887958|nr:QRFP-like peptide receptor [Gigantopelta aegis]
MSSTPDLIGFPNGTGEPDVTTYQQSVTLPLTNLIFYNSSSYESERMQASIKYGSSSDNISETTMAVFQNSTVNGTSFVEYEWTHPTLITYDFSHILYPGSYKHVALWEVVIKVITYIPIIVLALVGNFFVILVVAKNKRMRTTTNYYIVNLAIADLLVVVSCSWVHLLTDLTEGWILGAFFCRFNTFAQVLSLVASILTLTFIACDRFFGIVFSMKAHFIERRARYTIVGLWFCSVAVAAPMLVYRNLFEVRWKDHLEQWCDDNWPVVLVEDPLTNGTMPTIPARKIYYTFVSVVLFFLPTLLMTAAYAVIIWTLWSSQVPGERISKDIRMQTKLRKKTIVMLVLILLSFVLCWCPAVVILLYAEYRESSNSKLEDWFRKWEYFSRYLSHANSAINPIIYAGFNDNFKKGWKASSRVRIGSGSSLGAY